MADTIPPLRKEKTARESSKEREIEEIVKELVLPFLPAKSLFKFKCVSKKWYQRITNPFLAHKQSYYFQNLSGFFFQYNGTFPDCVSLNDVAQGVPNPHLTFLPEHVTITDSCNGLLLCQGRSGNSYYICNPTTENWQELPEPKLYHGWESSALIAFNSSPMNMVPHYKLICAVPLLDHPLVLFEMYTSQRGSWTTSEALCLKELSLTSNKFYLNGVAYWETTSREVLAFNLFNEFYEIIPLQDQTPPNGILTQIHGELCYIGVTKEGLGTEYCVMIYGGMDLSLKRAINVNIHEHEPRFNQLDFEYRVLPCLDGEVVMFLKGCYIFSYSLREERVKMVRRVPRNAYGADKFLAYVNSLAHVG